MERYFVIRRLTVRSLPISCLLIPGLRKVPLKKDKYGYLERENGVYYFKLNLKIGLLKR